MDGYYAEIRMFAGNFAPRGWAFCHGQLLPINTNQALFALIGTFYGGNGQTNFALPDLRGRVPLSFGQGAGLSNYDQGQAGGVESVNLNTTQIPAHNHTLSASNAAGTATTPSGNHPAMVVDPTANPMSAYGSGTLVPMNAASIGTTGGSQPHTNVQPYLTVNFIICIAGIFLAKINRIGIFEAYRRLFMKVGVISNNDLCVPLLYFLHNNKAEVNLYFGTSAVIDPKREDVPRFCSNYKICCSDQTKKTEDVYQWVDQIEPDLLFVIGHRQKIDIKKTRAKFGMYNIHFGKLPQYRGSSPLFWQMKNNEPTLGLCIHGLTEEMDAGPVYWSKVIRNEEYFSHNYVQYLFSNLLLEGVNEILLRSSDHSFQPIEQDEALATWYARPSLKDVLIKWDSMPADRICSLVRACNSWNVGAITLYQGMEMKIIDASYGANGSVSAVSPGTITGIADYVKISCINGDELNIHYGTLNSIPFAGRQAKFYGIIEGEKIHLPVGLNILITVQRGL